jgi:hypothetical protein
MAKKTNITMENLVEDRGGLAARKSLGETL